MNATATAIVIHTPKARGIQLPRLSTTCKNGSLALMGVCAAMTLVDLYNASTLHQIAWVGFGALMTTACWGVSRLWAFSERIDLENERLDQESSN